MLQNLCLGELSEQKDRSQAEDGSETPWARREIPGMSPRGPHFPACFAAMYWPRKEQAMLQRQ